MTQPGEAGSVNVSATVNESAPPPPPPPRAKIALPGEPIDVETLRSAKEKDLLEQLEADPAFDAFVTKLNQEQSPDAIRRRLLRRGMKITPAISPLLIKLIETIQKIVYCKAQIELFVEPGEELRARGSMSADGKSAFISVTSALIEKIPQRELLFIIGAEVGHLLFKHHEVPLEAMLEKWRGHLSPLQMFKVLAWRQFAQISADRIGLMCCQDYHIASDCLFKLTSGVTSGKLAFNLPDYLDQLVAIQNLDDLQATDDWFSDQPFSPLRIKALELFSQTDRFQQAIRLGVGTLTFPTMEERLDEFLAILFPSFIADDSETSSQIKDFVIYAALMVAYANGVLVKEEAEQIDRLFGKEAVEERIKRLTSNDPNLLLERVTELSEPISMKVVPAQRCQILRDLVLIAAADGVVDEHEYGALFDLAELLDVPTDFVERMAEEYLNM